MFFTFLLNKVSDTPYPPKGVDLCLMTSKVRNSFNNLSEKSGFIQSLVMNLGYKQKFIEYDRKNELRVYPNGEVTENYMIWLVRC